MRLLSLLALSGLLLASPLAGCGNKGGDAPPPQPSARPTSTPAPTPSPTPSATQAPTPTSPPPSGPRASASAFALAPGRTPIPTPDEWVKQKHEVTVKGSSALSCETKMVREYLRVSCKGKNDSGGTPTGIKLTRGARDAQTFAGNGVVSLILPVVEGTSFEATFSWTDKSHPLTVKWPKGTKMPVVLGVFEGAKSPLDRSAGAVEAHLCECHKKVFKTACDDLLGGADEDCDRTYGNDCAMLLACSRGEPGAMPSCRPGWLNGPPFGHCFQACGAGKPACPSGTTCQEFGAGKMCLIE